MSSRAVTPDATSDGDDKMTEETAGDCSRRNVLKKTGASGFALTGLPVLAGAAKADDDDEEFADDWWSCSLAAVNYTRAIIRLDALSLLERDMEELGECFSVSEDIDPDEIYDDHRWTAGA